MAFPLSRFLKEELSLPESSIGITHITEIRGGEPSSVIRDGVWKLIHYYKDGRDELYNLRIDQSEKEILNAQYPEKIDYLSKKLSV